MKNIFGDEIPDLVISAASRKPTVRKGYAATPGTGPKGETCKSCMHSIASCAHSKTFYKCQLMRRHWTHGQGSDILLKSPACRFWVAEKDAVIA